MQRRSAGPRVGRGGPPPTRPAEPAGSVLFHLKQVDNTVERCLRKETTSSGMALLRISNDEKEVC